MQDNSSQRHGKGHLRKQKAQAEARMTSSMGESCLLRNISSLEARHRRTDESKSITRAKETEYWHV